MEVETIFLDFLLLQVETVLPTLSIQQAHSGALDSHIDKGSYLTGSYFLNC